MRVSRVENLTSNLRRETLLAGEASFGAELRPVAVANADGSFRAIENRRAIVRVDTGEPLEVVSDVYKLVQHREILASVEDALARLGLGDVPRRVHMMRGGAVMKALFKIEPRSFNVAPGDALCPMIRVGNSYDTTQRVTMELGAFRRVCTNLAVGGGGIFAEGFRSLHAGDIDPAKTADSMAQTIESFPRLVETFREWQATQWTTDRRERITKELGGLGQRHAQRLGMGFTSPKTATVWDAYNTATEYATHQTRTAAVAYRLLAEINNAFTGN